MAKQPDTTEWSVVVRWRDADLSEIRCRALFEHLKVLLPRTFHGANQPVIQMRQNARIIDTHEVEAS